MKKNEKSDESADSSSFNCLPDEMLLQILSRLIDIETLCRCKLVSIRFNNTVQQVDAISVTITSADHPSSGSNTSSVLSKGEGLANLFESESSVSMMKSLQTFSALKSLSIEIPSFLEALDNILLFKWKFEFGNKTDSLLFLSPISVCEAKENVQGEEEYVQLSIMKILVAMEYLKHVSIIRSKLSRYMKCFPLLENLTITDAGKRGRVSICGKIKKLVPKINKRLRACYVPLLKLPVSGYLMKGVYLIQFEGSDLPGDDYSSVNMNLNDFEDREEDAYNEAVMEVFKRNGWMEVLHQKGNISIT